MGLQRYECSYAPINQDWKLRRMVFSSVGNRGDCDNVVKIYSTYLDGFTRFHQFSPAKKNQESSSDGVFRQDLATHEQGENKERATREQREYRATETDGNINTKRLSLDIGHRASRIAHRGFFWGDCSRSFRCCMGLRKLRNALYPCSSPLPERRKALYISTSHAIEKKEPGKQAWTIIRRSSSTHVGSEGMR